MFRYSCALLPVILQFIFVREVSCTLCAKEESVFDRTHIICPGPYDPSNKVYCCGPKKLRFCCSYEEYESGFFQETMPTEDFPAREGNYRFTISITTIGIIVGVLVTSVVVVVIIVVVSCFCCNGCLPAQHQNRQEDTTYTASQPATTTTTATAHYSAQPPYPVQPFTTGYPQQHPPAAISSTEVIQPSIDILCQEHFQYPGTLPETTKRSPTPPSSRPIGWLVSRRQPPSNRNLPPYPMNDQPPYPINDQPPCQINDQPPYPINDQPPYPIYDQPPSPINDQPPYQINDKPHPYRSNDQPPYNPYAEFR